jgi:hypothetical protein
MKSAGASCPKCLAYPTAEYAQAGQPAKWTCNACSASGDLIGDVARRSEPEAAAPVKQPPPWARNLTRSRP